MRAYVRFVGLCLSLTAGTAAAATLIEVKEPAKIADAFPRQATIRVLNVWATWCVPCVAEIPDLRAISAAFGPEVAIVGVSLDDMIPGDRASIKAEVAGFLDRNRITYSNIYYSGTSDALADTLRFSGEIPITLVYDRAGRELWRREGKLDRKKTIAEIRKLLGRNR
jgi:thiol-disulfide isomerase/thioredoxin